MAEGFMLLMAIGLAVLVYGEGSGKYPAGAGASRIRLKPVLLIHALPLLAYTLAMGIEWITGDGGLARYPVAGAAAIFYAILIIATRRLTLSLALSLGVAALASLPSPLL
ncbi:MAG: hypothetical protein K0Q90_582 [Paenibacillaceae bacterium]|jgi:hypothetical protein|nr:hypothetical protein [Paenibacillaceae bacterium]